MNFDVRGGVEITELTFADETNDDYMPNLMTRNPLQSGGLRLTDTESDRYMVIRNREHFDNLIKAYKKAVELGWI